MMETDNNCRIHIAIAKVKTMFLPGAVRGQDLVNDAGLKQVLQKFDYVAVRPDVQQCKTTEAGDMKCVTGTEITGIKWRHLPEDHIKEQTLYHGLAPVTALQVAGSATILAELLKQAINCGSQE